MQTLVYNNLYNNIVSKSIIDWTLWHNFSDIVHILLMYLKQFVSFPVL
jgi:hypothetical protein